MSSDANTPTSGVEKDFGQDFPISAPMFFSSAALFSLGAGASCAPIVAADVSHQHLTHLFGENLSIHPGTLPPTHMRTRLEHRDRLSLGFCATLQHFPLSFSSGRFSQGLYELINRAVYTTVKIPNDHVRRCRL